MLLKEDMIFRPGKMDYIILHEEYFSKSFVNII